MSTKRRALRSEYFTNGATDWTELQLDTSRAATRTSAPATREEIASFRAALRGTTPQARLDRLEKQIAEMMADKNEAIRKYARAARAELQDLRAASAEPTAVFRQRLRDLETGCRTTPGAINDRAYREKQRAKARKPRLPIKGGAVEGDTSVSVIIRTELAAKQDSLGEYMPAKDLWPRLYSRLDGLGQRPKMIDGDEGERIEYGDGDRQITFASFKVMLSKARSKLT